MRPAPILMCLAIASMASTAAADNSFRPATVAEITRELPGLNNLTMDGNGYAYAPDSVVGYKVSKGEICVRTPNRHVDCVRVEFDGENMRTVDGMGNRELLN